MRYVPWHVKGVRPEVREVARDAARRSGLSVGAWLNSLIIDAAAGNYRRPASFDHAARLQPARIDDEAFAAIRKDIDQLKRQMSRPQVEPADFEERLLEIEARIDVLQSSTRCDDVAEALRRHFAEFRDTLKEAPQVDEIAKVWRHDLEEISATLQDAMPTSVIAALEGQVRALGERLAEHWGADAPAGATADVEQALADIGDRLRALTPAEELGELSNAVELLSSKADAIATESTASEQVQQLERAIGALHGLASQVASRDVVAALSHEIKALGDKIDRNSRPAFDSDFRNTLERRLDEIAQAVGRRRPDEGAPVPADFDPIIKALADRLAAVQIPAAGEGALKSLEQRIDTLVDKLANFETQSHHRDGVDRGMDELLAQLKELREQSESRLAAIQQQVAASAAEAIGGPAESIRRDVASLKEIQTSVDQRTQDTFEAVYGTIEQVVDRLATFEDELRDRHYASHAGPLADKPESRSEPAAAQIRVAPAMVAEAPALVPSSAPVADRTAPAVQPQGECDCVAMAPSDILPPHPSATTATVRHPDVSDFAAGASHEPGSAARRVRIVANAIDRIAASEAVTGIAKPAETSAPARAKFVAAARRAAQTVASEHKGTPTDRFEKHGQDAGQNFSLGTLFGRLRPRAKSVVPKSVVLGVSVVLLMVGVLRLPLDFLHHPVGQESVLPVTQMDDVDQPGGESVRSEPPVERPPTRQAANLPSPTLPVPFNANLLPGETTLGRAPGWGIPPDMAASATIPAPAATQAPAATPDVDASSPRRTTLLQWPAGRDAASQFTSSVTPDVAETPLPPTIGGKALLAAASAGDPGASYEIAIRLVQGRNAAPDFAAAAAWLEQAARSGLAPAQFRLGSMYEKGLGVKKDLGEARRLYVAAADKGHAKAMHNLAVLYAGGLDGKPDYAVASQWFRRAAAHGIVDSQYNLAILYARGVGVERNLAESYKWFALAAKGGDKDAARKRDDVAMWLDARQLESAKLNVESFVAVPQPDEATAIKAPAGGWDQVMAAATTKSKALVRPERYPGK
jgi:localization factor PodJL